MEYKKITNVFDNKTNQPSKFRTRNLVEINDESREKCGSRSIKFKTSMIRSDLCEYDGAYILVSGTIAITEAVDNDKGVEIKE